MIHTPPFLQNPDEILLFPEGVLSPPEPSFTVVSSVVTLKIPWIALTMMLD